MDKKMIARICLAVFWVGLGVFQIAAKSMIAMGALSIVVGLVFAFDALRNIKKK